ncbi:uncharacterized protein TrAtP1_010754 [Trichoderma atroviride]|uniref:uncharacterized protein n=1 Tax=Hypocrea atroviridis TaxID=63577 RepID=UPI00331E7CC8|nr:hypothetical protein TrAtP1_010754 [Trichoderma atroviride]
MHVCNCPCGCVKVVEKGNADKCAYCDEEHYVIIVLPTDPPLTDQGPGDQGPGDPAYSTTQRG